MNVPTHPNFQMAIDRNVQAPAPPMGTAASWIWNFEPSKRKTGQYPVSPRKHRGITLVAGKIIEILEVSMFSDPVDMSNLKARLQMDTSIKPSQAEVLWLTHITLTEIPGVLSHIMVSLVANGSTFSKKPVVNRCPEMSDSKLGCWFGLAGSKDVGIRLKSGCKTHCGQLCIILASLCDHIC